MARGGSLALLALWSWLLLRDHRRALSARVGVLMTGAVGCHIIVTMIGPVAEPGVGRFLLWLGATSVPGLFWLFATSWFNDAARVGWRNWMILGAAMALAGSQIGLLQQGHMPSFEVQVLMRIMSFGFGLAGLWEAWRGRNDDLVETRRRVRRELIWAVGLYVLLTNVVEVLVHIEMLPVAAKALVEVGIMLLCLGTCAVMLRVREPALFAPSRTDASDPPRFNDPALAEKLRAHMASERAWRDERLSIAGLAAQLGEQEYRLRRLINGQLGHRNFAAFLNGYRLDEVKQALADPAQREVPIITIALDAGFGSLGPFNRAFREAEGMTPSEYRAAHG